MSSAGSRFLGRRSRLKAESSKTSAATGFLKSRRNGSRPTKEPAAPSPSPQAKSVRSNTSAGSSATTQEKIRRSSMPTQERRPSSKQNPRLRPSADVPSPWKHQLQTQNLLRREQRVLDFSDPGTGKTRSALEVFAERRRQGSKSALVVCPKSLMEPAWGADIRKFTPDMVYICAYAENRENAFGLDVDIYITNTDAVKWLAKKPKSFFNRFDTLIIDELTAYKHRTSARSKALAKIREHFKFREGMTGTPNPNSVTELWHQAFIIDDGKRLGTSFFHFRAQCCSPEQVGPKAEHIRWVDKPGAEEAVAHLLRDITVRHEFDTVMDIPPNYSRSICFTLPKRLKAQYEELEEHAILELENDSVSAVNAAVLHNKLLQLASGAVYSDTHYQVLDTSRYELLADLIEERKHSITFFNWQHQKEQLSKLLNMRGVSHAIIDGTVPVRKREEIVAGYQAGLYQTVLLHPQTGAHGLTLTRGTAVIWASPIYQADFLKQGIHRIVRGGQTQKTETLFIEASGTLEPAVYQKLNDKTQRMASLLEILKEAK